MNDDDLLVVEFIPTPWWLHKLYSNYFFFDCRRSGKTPATPTTTTSTSTSTAAVVEVLQFTKYFHLVPAQGLRLAATTAPCFEAALVAATAGGGGSGSGGAPSERLLRRPSIFTLSLVFESPQVPAPALAATLGALRPELDISKLFLDSPSGDDSDDTAAAADGGASTRALRYQLRCMVCYSSSHYFAFALSEAVGQWLLLDDAHVSAAGRWEDVVAMATQRRLQPSLLFYEAVKQNSNEA